MNVIPAATDNITVRLARDAAEIAAAQHLRYRVFYEELGARPTPEMAAQRRDISEYDAVTDHLIVIDAAIDDPGRRIVGTYRLLREDVAKKFGRFYSSAEFDITPLTKSHEPLLELGRSCVQAEYRTRPVLQALWQGIANYFLEHDIGLLFGCASLPGTCVADWSRHLAYLYHYHLAPPALRPRALQDIYVEMNLHPVDDLDPRKLFATLPPLVKGYLRVGAMIGEGAFIDRQWNSIDVCIVMPTLQIADRYRKHWDRGRTVLAGGREPGAEADPASACALNGGG